jgi:hypothetical protein
MYPGTLFLRMEVRVGGVVQEHKQEMPVSIGRLMAYQQDFGLLHKDLLALQDRLDEQVPGRILTVDYYDVAKRDRGARYVALEDRIRGEVYKSGTAACLRILRIYTDPDDGRDTIRFRMRQTTSDSVYDLEHLADSREVDHPGVVASIVQLLDRKMDECISCPKRYSSH